MSSIIGAAELEEHLQVLSPTIYIIAYLRAASVWKSGLTHAAARCLGMCYRLTSYVVVSTKLAVTV
jgi:hypothetical protein